MLPKKTAKLIQNGYIKGSRRLRTPFLCPEGVWADVTGRSGDATGRSEDASGRSGDVTRRSRNATGPSGDATGRPGGATYDLGIPIWIPKSQKTGTGEGSAAGPVSDHISDEF